MRAVKRERIMGRYLCLWEIHHTAIPTSNEGWAQWEDMLGWLKEQMEGGFFKDWGQFIGELRGYAVIEGSEMDVSRMAQRLIGVCSFHIHPIASVDQVGEMVRGLTRAGQ